MGCGASAEGPGGGAARRDAPAEVGWGALTGGAAPAPPKMGRTSVGMQTFGRLREKVASPAARGGAIPGVVEGYVEDAYTLGETLGRGAFSIVKLGTKRRPASASGWSTIADGWRQHGGATRAAVKIMPLKQGGDDDPRAKAKREVLREVGVLAQVSHHPNIVSLYAAYLEPYRCALVLELCSGGCVMEVVLERGGLGTDDGRRCAHPLLCAIAFLHGRGFAHRDVKPENLLLPHRRFPACLGELKLGDFNLSRKFNANRPREAAPKPKTQPAQKQQQPQMAAGDAMRTIAGTPAFLAPEVAALGSTDDPTEPSARHAGYDEKADVWSAACSLYLVCTGYVPFAHSETFAGAVDRCRKLPSFSKPVWRAQGARGPAPGSAPPDTASADDGRDLLKSMLAFAPMARPSAADCLAHPFVTNAPKGTPSAPASGRPRQVSPEAHAVSNATNSQQRGNPSPRRIRIRQMFVRDSPSPTQKSTPSPPAARTTVSQALMGNRSKAAKQSGPSTSPVETAPPPKAATAGRRARPPATAPRRDSAWHHRRYQMAVQAAIFKGGSGDDDAEQERLRELKDAYVAAKNAEAEEARAREAPALDENADPAKAWAEPESPPEALVKKQHGAVRALRSGGVMSPLKPIHNRMREAGGDTRSPQKPALGVPGAPPRRRTKARLDQQ